MEQGRGADWRHLDRPNLIETNPPRPSGQQPAWLSAMQRYSIALAGGNVVWEVAQLPLYTIWTEGQWAEITFAAAHCTAGDVLIATATLVLALLLAGDGSPHERRAFRRVAAITIAAGVGYTVFSEWLNTHGPQELGLFGADAGCSWARGRAVSLGAVDRHSAARLLVGETELA